MNTKYILAVCAAVVLMSPTFVTHAYYNQNYNQQYQQQYQVNAPSNLRAYSNGRGSVSLQWQDNSSNESSFWIRRTSSPNGDTDGDGDFIAKVSPNTTSFTDYNARPGRTYYYRIRVASQNGFPQQNQRNYTIWSNQVQVTVR